MTREEAIKLIGSMKGDLRDFYDDNDLTALEMAISALKESKGDLISRQAVLEAIEDDNRNGHYSCFASNNDAQCFKQIINELPSGSENIRCKDCKFLKVAGDDIFTEHMCGNAESWVVATDLNFGCVLAERAEE